MGKKYQVGGIIYKILQHQNTNPEIIDLRSIVPTVHKPFVIDKVSVDGYDPQYSFRRDEEPQEVNPPIQQEVVQEVEQEPEIRQLFYGNPSQQKMPESEFHTTLYDAFIRAGVNENIAKFIVAQDSLETGDGKHHAGKYNYGNITAGSSWKGSTTSGNDTDGNGNKITQKFRNYDSIDHYVSDKISLLSSSRYRCALNANTIEEYARCVKQGGYATDPNYEQKLITKYHSLYG